MNRWGKSLLIAALVGVVAMAFRVSWNALKDVATATGADETAATLYPFVVDGLMALALVATLVLTGDARRFALRVLAAYTLASLVLNYVHGLVPELHDEVVDWGRLADWDPANWALVLLATSLPVGSIYFGSDLVAKVLHHRPIEHPTSTPNRDQSAETCVNRSTADLEVSTPAPITPTPAPAELPAAPVVSLVKSTDRVPVGVVAAESTRPRQATGRVPDVARSSRPNRTADQLLTEARTATADWTDRELTAEGIRKAVRTSPAKARVLRETLRAERGQSAGTGEAVA
ncbi:MULTISPECIES: DUF2637 domain-containing protein [Streptomyces]|uniref:DUF2637 domain-containing protein n=1 Tax=Streptomyces griseus subsp. griseus (strain JCM 4626 / CBS 651.72 / NBRC 13350 / KCC S-0626 / ISP 5235) TaxID=455632 RepID=B1W4S8_STRGG|nr:DUF2637 domain-containing protein [Streptomyces griseus]MBW3705362.1 DUF2637 domain-containing protein [Streptomyces griseus]BAG19722.1 hypothetical protein SGR_2893 [Streptomyces griseus subsp. griseus NBRC 13350]SEE87591.1 Protein of unknown function [Streptomyces griseus]SQA23592.1 DUF2637 domain containing protein [Streptomyces griseus]